nr:type II secretion system protein N [uncultured Tolumonas sp.]
MIKNYLLRRPLLLTLFLLGYLLFLLASLPAAQILPRLPLPAGLQLRNINGTLWQGSISDVSWQKYRLHNLQWEVLFSHLGLGMPTIKLDIQDPTATGTIGWRGKWHLSNWHIKTAANTLQSWAPVPLPINAAGAIQLNIEQLVVDHQACQTLTGQLNWQQALINTPSGALVLGNPIANLNCQNNELNAEVKQDSASLHTQASLQFTLQGQYKLQATLRPDTELPDGLHSALSWLGSPDNNGNILTKQEGYLPYF